MPAATRDGDGPLVDAAWVAQRLDAGTGSIKLVDATFFLPNEGKNAAEVYAAGHLPGAAFFDIDQVAAPGGDLPHMFPDAQRFAQQVGALGIRGDDSVVCYDQGRVVGACRAWWMFRSFGHAKVVVMDGGLALWAKQGRPVAHGVVVPPVAHYAVAEPAGPSRDVVAAEQVLDALDSSDQLVIDARSAGRFNATAPEPRAGLRGGHMPGAVNLPYDQLLDEQGCMLPTEQLRSRLSAVGVTPSTRVTTSCGSGVSAAVILLALELTGHQAMQLYDGSWSEWGAREELPVTA